MRALNVTPHIDQNTSGRRSALDARTTRHPDYEASQRMRKRIEEPFGWGKTIGGLARPCVRRKYCAFTIGPEELAISVCEYDARDDLEALEKATPLFHDELKRIEVWCGSRKVGHIPPTSNDISSE